LKGRGKPFWQRKTSGVTDQPGLIGYRPMGVFRQAVRSQRDRWFLWYAVAFVLGIASYFALPREPGVAVFLVAGMISATAITVSKKLGLSLRLMLVAMFLGGFVNAKLGTERLNTKTIMATTPTSLLVGRVQAMEQVSKNRVRLWLKVESASEIKTRALPELVRLTGKIPETWMFFGDRVEIKARLFPLPGPVKPRGFDFGRHLWFQGVGATGFFYGKVKPLTPTVNHGFSVRRYFQQLRYEIGHRIDVALPGPSGALAKALMTGNRGAIDKETTTDLRQAGLSHILAISGLHMSLVAGGVFWLFRALAALSGTLALNYPIKKWAAIAGMLAGLFYLVISGAGIATQRAFIMATIMFLAVLLDRPAISLRNVAIAAVIVTVIHPQAVISVSFQMSFMAVIGLISVFEQIRIWRLGRQGRLNPSGTPGYWSTKVIMFLVTIALTTFVASLYTAIPGAYHFHRVAVFAILGNLVALPLVTLIVMPGAIITILLMPLGLEGAGLFVMDFGIGLVTAHAGNIASLPNAQVVVPDLNGFSILAIGFSLIWASLWKGRLKLAAAVPLITGLAMIHPVRQPDVIVSKFGRNVAMMGQEGLFVVADARKSRFSVENWLVATGDAVSLKQAAKRRGWQCDADICRAEVATRKMVYLKKKAKPDKGLCRSVDIIISAEPFNKRCKSQPDKDPPVVIDRIDLWRAGAHAIYLNGDKPPTVESALGYRGERPWVIRPVPRRTILKNPEKHRYKKGGKNRKDKPFWKKRPKKPTPKPTPENQRDAKLGTGRKAA
jgi:competence protein ComEC